MIKFITKLFKKKAPKKKQTTHIWCKCGNELVGDAQHSLVRDIYVNGRNVVHYKCSKCNENSYWDFDHPAPLSLPFTKEDNIIDLYYGIFT
jgi:hypothetical protein